MNLEKIYFIKRLISVVNFLSRKKNNPDLVNCKLIVFCIFRYPEQESYPINLKKDSYYYIEALHKEQYGNDSLAAAVKTPDNKFYAPIPTKFLWTEAPPKPHGMLAKSINRAIRPSVRQSDISPRTVRQSDIRHRTV